MHMPMNIDFERRYWHKNRLVVGVDEVGRGCLAGPVVVGAVVFPINHLVIEGVDDSKKVSACRRTSLARLIRKQALAVGIGQVEAELIDRIGIVAAIRLAADQAMEKIVLDKNYVVASDGPRPIHSPISGVKSIAVVDGDATIYSIAAASIVAKVYRDELMHRYAAEYPGYGWETSVGYGTKTHQTAIRKLGLTPLHRRTFCAGAIKNPRGLRPGV